MDTLLQLFWLFIKVNLLTTSGPASVGLLHAEAVGTMMTEAQFVEAVGFSNALPGGEALKLAVYVGYSIARVPGALAALLGAVLPPTLIMFAVVAVLHRLRREAWVSNFVQGLTPSVAMLIAVVAWHVLRDSGSLNWQAALIGLGSLVAFALDVPAPLVLLLSGLVGIWLFA
ncbi:MAG: chromate transporter [Anaerolineae bacterium]|nr:MAG: chromate transporter [Anaerolineae bacterium]